MELEYRIEDLLIGYMTTIHSVGGSFGIVSSENGPYIFYKPDKNNMNLYKEVFTEDYYHLSHNTDKQKFGKTYIRQAQDDILSYLTADEIKNGVISKLRIVEIYRDANLKAYERQKFQQKIKKMSK